LLSHPLYAPKNRILNDNGYIALEIPINNGFIALFEEVLFRLHFRLVVVTKDNNFLVDMLE